MTPFHRIKKGTIENHFQKKLLSIIFLIGHVYIKLIETLNQDWKIINLFLFVCVNLVKTEYKTKIMSKDGW